MSINPIGYSNALAWKRTTLCLFAQGNTALPFSPGKLLNLNLNEYYVALDTELLYLELHVNGTVKDLPSTLHSGT